MNSALRPSPAIDFGYLFAAKPTSIQPLLGFYSKKGVHPAEIVLSAPKTKPMCTNQAADKFNVSCT